MESNILFENKRKPISIANIQTNKNVSLANIRKLNMYISILCYLTKALIDALIVIYNFVHLFGENSASFDLFSSLLLHSEAVNLILTSEVLYALLNDQKPEINV